MARMARASDPYTPEEIDTCLEALIAHAGNATAACEYLELTGNRTPHFGTLHRWANTSHFERYEQLREQYAPQREGQLANHYLDASIVAAEASMLAVAQAKQRLEDGVDPDPARTAANLASMAQRLTDKRLALQGRPQRILETRNETEILRSLLAKGVLKMPDLPDLPDEPKQIEATGEEA